MTVTHFFANTNFKTTIKHVYKRIPSPPLPTHLAGPRCLGHIVAGILCVLDRTNVGSIPLATVGASKRLRSDMNLILCMLYGQ